MPTDCKRCSIEELDVLDIAIRIATDGRAPADIAHDILTETGWLDD